MINIEDDFREILTFMSENDYNLRNRANIKKISTLRKLHVERMKQYKIMQIKKSSYWELLPS